MLVMVQIGLLGILVVCSVVSILVMGSVFVQVLIVVLIFFVWVVWLLLCVKLGLLVRFCWFICCIRWWKMLLLLVVIRMYLLLVYWQVFDGVMFGSVLFVGWWIVLNIEYLGSRFFVKLNIDLYSVMLIICFLLFCVLCLYKVNNMFNVLCRLVIVLLSDSFVCVGGCFGLLVRQCRLVMVLVMVVKLGLLCLGLVWLQLDMCSMISFGLMVESVLYDSFYFFIVLGWKFLIRILVLVVSLCMIFCFFGICRFI